MDSGDGERGTENVDDSEGVETGGSKDRQSPTAKTGDAEEDSSDAETERKPSAERGRERCCSSVGGQAPQASTTRE